MEIMKTKEPPPHALAKKASASKDIVAQKS